jgi:hypothetical protein
MADGCSRTNSDVDLQTVRAHVGAERRRCDDLPQVQVEALERAEATTEVEAGPPSAQTPDGPSPRHRLRR